MSTTRETTTPLSYWTNPDSGTLHAAPIFARARTLCGQSISWGWVEGDETLLAPSATCGRCRAIARSRNGGEPR